MFGYYFSSLHNIAIISRTLFRCTCHHFGWGDGMILKVCCIEKSTMYDTNNILIEHTYITCSEIWKNMCHIRIRCFNVIKCWKQFKILTSRVSFLICKSRWSFSVWVSLKIGWRRNKFQENSSFLNKISQIHFL